MKISKLERFARGEDKWKRHGIDTYTLDQLSKHNEFIKSLAGLYSYQSYPIESLRAMISDLGLLPTGTNAREALLKSSIFDSAREANLSAFKLIDSLTSHSSAIEEMKKLAGAQAIGWMNYKDLIAPQIPIDKFLTSHLSQITLTSALAQSALAGIDLAKIGSAFHVPDEIKASFSHSFTDFSTSYKDLFKSFEAPETSLFRLPPSISQLPTIEFFNGVDLLETTVEEENQNKYEEERIVVRDEIRESVNDFVIIQIREVNPDWLKMLQGARQALTSKNPDKTRHCIISLRELVTQIMHYLSPDNEVRSWSKSADDFSNNRPTRRARLRYISRNINHGAFTKLVEKDIELILAAFEVFQAGTHTANSKLTEAQAAALITKVEGFVSSLLSISNYEE